MYPGTKARHPNGILGILCREHYPGMVKIGEEEWRPAKNFDDYVRGPDAPDRTGRIFDNKQARVLGELWVSLCHSTLLNTWHSLEFF